MIGLGGPGGEGRGREACQAEGIIQKPGQARRRPKLPCTDISGELLGSEGYVSNDEIRQRLSAASQ